MVLDASRNVVAVQIWVTVTGTLENVQMDVILDTTLPSAKKVSFSLLISSEIVKVHLEEIFVILVLGRKDPE